MSVNRAPQVEIATRQMRPAIALGATLLGTLIATLVFALTRGAGWLLEWATPAGFAISALAVYVLLRVSTQRIGVPLFVATVSLVYFLEAGVLAVFLDLARLPELVAAAGAALFGWVVVVGSLFFLQAGEGGEVEDWGDGWRSGLSVRLVLAFIAYALALRLLFSVLPELLHEEAYYWAFARFPDLSYLDHPPLVAWIVWLTTRVLGHTELGVRAGPFLAMLVATGFLHALTRRMSDRDVAWGTTLLISALPAYFMAGWVTTPDAPVFACWSAALYFLYRALIDGEKWAWTGVAVAFGLGMLAKYTMGLFGLAGLVFILQDRESRRWLVSPRPYLAAVLAGLIFSPVILWNIRHDWVSIWWQTGRRITGKSDFDLFELLGTAVVMLTPIGVASFLSLRADRDEGRDRARRLLFIMTLVPFAVFALFSITRNIKFNWTAPCWLASLPLLAEPLIRGVPAGARPLARWAQIGWRPMLVAVLLLQGAGLHYLALGLAGQRYGLNETGLGWRDLGVRFERVVDAAEAESGMRPIVVGMDADRIAGWLAFYRSRALALSRGEVSSGEAAATTSSDHLLGRKGSFYRWNFPPEAYAGQNMILVAHMIEDLEGEKVEERSGRLGPIHTIEAHKNGRVASRYYYRTLYDYRPRSAQDSRSFRRR